MGKMKDEGHDEQERQLRKYELVIGEVVEVAPTDENQTYFYWRGEKIQVRPWSERTYFASTGQLRTDDKDFIDLVYNLAKATLLSTDDAEVIAGRWATIKHLVDYWTRREKEISK